MELDSLDDLVDLESRFYDQGYAEGLAHGKQHGYEEGRELGTSKGWELWEELGYYEGFAMFWKAALVKQGKQDSRANGLLQQLIELIDGFPMENDSSLLTEPSQEPDKPGQDLDSMLSAIRSKYRTACASLGVRPRPKVATETEQATTNRTTTDVKMLANEI